MNIYYVSIHRGEDDTIFDIYYGEADTMQEAMAKAILVAKAEGCKNPVVAMVKWEGKKAF